MSAEKKSENAGSLSGVFLKVKSVADTLTLALNVIGTVLVFLLVILINADVIGRTVFLTPISGVPEIVSMSIVAIVFLQIAQTVRMGRLTRTEALLNGLARYAPRLRAAFEFVFAAIALFVIWALYTASFGLFVKSWDRQTFVGTVGDFIAPIWPVKLVILIGCIALSVQFLLVAVTALMALFGAHPETGKGSSSEPV